MRIHYRIAAHRVIWAGMPTYPTAGHEESVTEEKLPAIHRFSFRLILGGESFLAILTYLDISVKNENLTKTLYDDYTIKFTIFTMIYLGNPRNITSVIDKFLFIPDRVLCYNHVLIEFRNENVR